MSIDKITRLYHFCDSRNLSSILEHDGLYSLDECERRGIKIPMGGGDAASQLADRENGFHRYVHLGFTTNHPMAHRAVESGRIQKVVYIHVARDILEQPGVLFVPGLANTTGIPTYPIAEAVTQTLIDFESLYSWTDWSDSAIQARRQQAEKYEILVPDVIHLDRILYLPSG